MCFLLGWFVLGVFGFGNLLFFLGLDLILDFLLLDKCILIFFDKSWECFLCIWFIWMICLGEVDVYLFDNEEFEIKFEFEENDEFLELEVFNVSWFSRKCKLFVWLYDYEIDM